MGDLTSEKIVNRDIGISAMLLTAATVLALSLFSLNWLTGIAGGAFLITGLASWKWRAGVKYALGMGIIILVSSIPFLFSKDSPWFYGTLGTLVSVLFLSGASITMLYDKRALEVSPSLKKGA